MLRYDDEKNKKIFMSDEKLRMEKMRKIVPMSSEISSFLTFLILCTFFFLLHIHDDEFHTNMKFHLLAHDGSQAKARICSTTKDNKNKESLSIFHQICKRRRSKPAISCNIKTTHNGTNLLGGERRKSSNRKEKKLRNSV